MLKSSNIVWHSSEITRKAREESNAHRSFLLWFTGLSGSGKSTLAHRVENRLHARQYNTYVLDGDNVRHGLCGDLGFSDLDRTENIRRIGEVSRLMVDAGVITLSAFISPFRSDRDRVRGMFQGGDFIEVYCRCDLNTCEKRDVKGLYKKARAGEIKAFTGIDSPYEAPLNPEIIIDTAEQSLDEATDLILEHLEENYFKNFLQAVK